MAVRRLYRVPRSPISGDASPFAFRLPLKVDRHAPMKAGSREPSPRRARADQAAGGTQAVSVSSAHPAACRARKPPSLADLVRDALLDLELAARQHVGDPLACVAVAVDRLGLVAPVLELAPHGVHDLAAVVGDVDHVRAALAALLAGPDVHGRRARE